MPLPLNMDYSFKATFQCRLDVNGATLGGDGSGGEHSRDPRLRRAGFGLVAIRLNGKDSLFDYLGHAYGSIPGKQTVPRAEATAILHALIYTKGNALYVCDNLGVAKSYWKGSRFQPASNGLLWRAINTARQQRLELGLGFLEVIWMPSHTSFESAINQGYSAEQWIANRFADKLATDAAKAAQVPDDFVQTIRDSTTSNISLLRYLVEVAVGLAPKGCKALHAVKSQTPTLPKEERVRQLAIASGHKLDMDDVCVLCNLRLPLHKSFGLCEVILNMKCVGAVSLWLAGFSFSIPIRAPTLIGLGRLKSMPHIARPLIMGLKLPFAHSAERTAEFAPSV